MAVTSASRLDSVIADFEASWRSGSRPRAEGWLDRLDASRPAEATELIYHEFCLAEADGLAPNPDDYLARFPDRRESLHRLFKLHSLTPDDESPPLPTVGDDVGPYRLRRLIGKGSFAGVYLAEQTDLAGRYVVVKITTRPSLEPELLARVSHAHIVSIIRHGLTPDGAFQLIFMPFLGGETLLAIGGETRRIGHRPRSGRDLLDRLDRVAAPEYPSADLTRPAREILGRLPYAKAIAYIFARLAEALDHAYRCGVAHGDVKPSNILITADGLPMLFDFNLSIDCLDDDAGLGGGTLAYMPPERLRALDRARQGESGSDPPTDLHRADLYALGLVLIETLTGMAPSVATGSPAELAASRDGGVTVFPDWFRLPIPAALRPILAHCLAADPTDRYETGRSLAADLDRWRSDLPPISAPDAGPTARLARWASRRRVVVAAGLLTMIAALGAGTVISRKYQSTISDSARARHARFLDSDELSLFAFRPFASWTKPPIDEADAARRKLNAYGVVDDPRWRERDDVRTLPASDRDDLELLMLEQVYRFAAAYADRPDSPADWRRALDLVEREARHVSASPLERLRDDLRRKLGLGKLALSADRVPRPEWIEEYLLGVEAEPVNTRAFSHYEKAIEARPDLLWPRYRDAVSAFPIGHCGDAVIHLRVAVGMRPDNPALHTHLATALFHLGKFEEAGAECDRAVTLNPDFAVALYDRSIVDSHLGSVESKRRHASRSALLTRASARFVAEKIDIQSFFSRSIMNRQSPGADSQIESLLHKIAAADPSDVQVKVHNAMRLGRSGHPAKAIAALDDVLASHPEHLRARYNRAYFLHVLQRPEAIEEYSALIDDPRFPELYSEVPEAIRVFHHITNDHLIRGRFDEAIKVAERGLAESLVTDRQTAESYYSLARSIAASDRPDLDRARRELRHAVDLDGNLANWYGNDRFFSRIREADPTFLLPVSSPGSSVRPAR